MAISVDPQTFIITIPQSDLTLVSGTIYELDTDWFRLALKTWEWDGNNQLGGISFLKTHTHNTTVTVAGTTYARTIEILPPYSVEFEDGQYTVILIGSNNNIFDVAAGILVQNQVQVIPTNAAGLIQISTGSGVTEQDKLDIADRVWDENLSTHSATDSASTALRSTTYKISTIHLDTVNGSAGTTWPIGTSYKPSNNLTDTLTLANYANVVDIVLGSDITVGATDDVSNKMLRSLGLMGIDVVLTSGCTANSTSFRNINLSGTLTSGDQVLVYDSSIGILENFRGIMNNVSFSQGSEITLDGWATIIQGTAGGDPTNEVEIDIGTASLNVSHWTGNLKLKGKTGTDRTVINCDSGNIIIDSTCTAGIIQLIGTGQVEQDNSGPGCTVDTDALQNVENVVGGVWGASVDDHNILGSFGNWIRKILYGSR